MVVSYIFNSQIAYGDGDEICYPESDGSPIAESDPTRNYLKSAVRHLHSSGLNAEQIATIFYLSIDKVRGYI